MVDLLPTTEQLVQTMRDADVGRDVRTCKIGLGICVPGATPNECLFGIMVGDHAGPIYRLPATAIVEALNSTTHWEVVTADEHAALVADRRALAKLEEENAALRRKLTAEIDRNRELAAKLDQADALLMRMID